MTDYDFFVLSASLKNAVKDGFDLINDGSDSNDRNIF